MNIVQINKFIEKIVGCTELVHSFYTDSVYECWNGSGDVDYGSFVFCIKKTRMRERTMIYDAIVYYGDRLLDDKSNRDAIWSDATNVIQSIIGAVNNVEGEISIGYPYEINLFEQKFADELAGAYANISIEVEGVGECADLLYGYENTGDDIKLESITRTFTVNGTYDIVTGDDYDAIGDVKVIVDVIPTVEDLFKQIGYNNEESSGCIRTISDDIEYAKYIKDVKWSDNRRFMDNEYQNDVNLVYFPYVNTSRVESMRRTFQGCRNLYTIPLLDTSNVENMQYTFENCENLSTIPQFNTRKVNDMYSIFSGCKNLSTIPLLDTSNVTDMRAAFNNCENLSTIPLLDTSNVTDMQYIFSGCTSLTSIPPLNTTKVTNVGSMFYKCSSLTTIPPLDFSNVTNVGWLFNSCSELMSLPDLNLSKVTKFFDSSYIYGWLYSCSKLQSIGVLDCDSVTDIRYVLGGTNNNLTHLGGFRNLGKTSSLTGTNTNYFMTYAPNLTYQSIMNVLNLLYDRAANGLSNLTLKLRSNHMALLSDEDKLVAVNKGWTLTT